VGHKLPEGKGILFFVFYVLAPSKARLYIKPWENLKILKKLNFYVQNQIKRKIEE